MKKATTLGDLIAEIFERYYLRYHDRDLARRATEATLNDLFFAADSPKARRAVIA